MTFSRWPTCQLKIIMGICMKVYTMFLVPGHQSESKKSTKIIFIAFSMCKKKNQCKKKLICYCETVFWAKNSKKTKFFKPFGLDPPPTSGHGTTSRFPLEPSNPARRYSLPDIQISRAETKPQGWKYYKQSLNCSSHCLEIRHLVSQILELDRPAFHTIFLFDSCLTSFCS